MIILLIGPPGSGKGTQAQVISKKFNLPNVSTGEIFRKAVESGDVIGKKVSEYMSKGMLVPSEVVDAVVESVLSRDEYVRGCVLDGYPRTLDQAKFLEKIIKQEIEAVYFSTDEEVIIKRLLGRFSCADCGAIYNKYYSPTKIENVCDSCYSSKFSFRTDDNEQSIHNRLEVYKAETYPVIKYFEDKGRCHLVNASKTPAEVSQEMAVLINRLKERTF